ncbi:hypothetical protein [Winogradskyella sp. A3E31]|uniref:hypothetical protein n=1 Tax=Winogradskyella sp. A3E31 TaxID=3349637 RepID=UPI00398B0E97
MNWSSFFVWAKSILIILFAFSVFSSTYNLGESQNFMSKENARQLKYLVILLYAIVYIIELKRKNKMQENQIKELEAKLSTND